MTEHEDEQPNSGNDRLRPYQWALVWFALSCFGFVGAVLRSAYVDEVPVGEAVPGGLGAIAIVTVVLVPYAIIKHFSDRLDRPDEDGRMP